MATNVVVLIGRLTKDPEISYSVGENSTAVATFFLAVERYSKSGKLTDYIRCKAFNKTAEIIEKYCKKGKQISVIGEIHTSDYTKDGSKNYLTEVVARSIELLGVKIETKEVQEEIPTGFNRLADDIPFE